MYTNESLDQKSRKIATIASLLTSGNILQLCWHICGALENNLINKDEIKQIIFQMTIYWLLCGILCDERCKELIEVRLAEDQILLMIDY